MKRPCALLLVLALCLPAAGLASDMIPKPLPPATNGSPSPAGRPSTASDYLRDRLPQKQSPKPSKPVKPVGTKNPASLQ
jgi:hypothetical protein